LETADRARQRAEQSEQAALSSEQAAKASELSARRMSYRTDVQRAYDFYLSNNWFDASRSLANQIPTEPQKDLRGLEWRWLDAEINAKLHRLGSHDGPATGCVVFPDGNTVATAGEDGFVRLWDAKARKMIKLIDPQLGPIHAMAISPDGETLAIAVGPSFATFGQGIVRLLKSRTGEKFGVVRFHRTTIDSVEFSPDGKLLAAGSRYDNVSLSTVEGKPLHVFPSDTYNRTCAFSPDSRELAFLADPSLLRVVDCLTGKVTTDIRLREKGTDEAAPAHAVRLSPDGQYLAVAYRYRGFLKTYDAQTGHELAVLHAHLAARPRINALEFQVDGGAIVAGDTVGQHHRWFIDLDSWRTHVRDHGEPAVVLADALPSTVDKTATNACASISSSAVVSVHDSGQVVLAAPDQTAAKVRPLPPTVTTAVPNSTDSIILGTKDGTIQAYNIKTGKYRQLTADSSERVVDLAVCEDGRVVAAAYWNGQVELVDTHSRAVKWTRPDTLEQFDINTDFFVDVSSDGNRIACTGEDDQLIVWDLISSKTLFQQELSQSGLSVRFSHSQNLLAHTAKSLTIYEVGTWKPILRKDITEIGPVAFRQDDRQLACCLPDGSMRLINLVTEEMQILHTGSSRMRDVGYSADGRTLLATGISSEVVREDGAGGLAIYLWESETGEKFGEFRHDLKAADHNRMFVVGDRVIVCTIPLRPKSDDDFKIAVWDLAP